MEMQEDQKKREERGKKAAAGYMLFELGAQFALILALPLLAFVYFGRWLERKYDSQIFIVAGILLALSLSSYLIYKKIEEVKKILK
ncbi:MAG: AtpZ/AtpI family protein [Candidatus Magasanikbacteria bacterium]|nr:AtpZ/AtpI family protein [Candidatus Magasanikbacteria bacterium]